MGGGFFAVRILGEDGWLRVVEGGRYMFERGDFLDMPYLAGRDEGWVTGGGS